MKETRRIQALASVTKKNPVSINNRMWANTTALITTPPPSWGSTSWRTAQLWTPRRTTVRYCHEPPPPFRGKHKLENSPVVVETKANYSRKMSRATSSPSLIGENKLENSPVVVKTKANYSHRMSRATFSPPTLMGENKLENSTVVVETKSYYSHMVVTSSMCVHCVKLDNNLVKSR